MKQLCPPSNSSSNSWPEENEENGSVSFLVRRPPLFLKRNSPPRPLPQLSEPPSSQTIESRDPSTKRKRTAKQSRQQSRLSRSNRTRPELTDPATPFFACQTHSSSGDTATRTKPSNSSNGDATTSIRSGRGSSREETSGSTSETFKGARPGFERWMVN